MSVEYISKILLQKEKKHVFTHKTVFTHSCLPEDDIALSPAAL